MNIQELIANMGFPIVVSLILILRTEGKVDRLTDSINNLIKEIQKLSQNIKE